MVEVDSQIVAMDSEPCCGEGEIFAACASAMSVKPKEYDRSVGVLIGRTRRRTDDDVGFDIFFKQYPCQLFRNKRQKNI
jgi:hypothetical protein